MLFFIHSQLALWCLFTLFCSHEIQDHCFIRPVPLHALSFSKNHWHKDNDCYPRPWWCGGGCGPTKLETGDKLACVVISCEETGPSHSLPLPIWLFFLGIHWFPAAWESNLPLWKPRPLPMGIALSLEYTSCSNNDCPLDTLILHPCRPAIWGFHSKIVPGAPGASWLRIRVLMSP